MAEEQTVSHVHVSSAAVPIPRNPSQESISSSPTTARLNWKLAVKKAKELSDSWEKFHFDTIPARKARRYIYDPRRRVWLKDKNHIVIKMQDEPFAHGAMRECFRMKKLSQFSHQPDWQNASNYVAKRYMKEQPRSVYKQDVQLQMDAKLWGEKYSMRNPPKKVDFFQAYLIELFGDDGKEEEEEEEEDKEANVRRRLFCVEHFVEGKYIKYNSNSGFVSDVKRLTPQAFSHFTFENSGHKLIVVDVQGVGDLYTDPQIHTADLIEYGEGNLGTRGMALFFSSHICNPLCLALKLTQFDLSQNEIDRLKGMQSTTTSTAPTVSSSTTVDSRPPMAAKHPLSLDLMVESTVEAFQQMQFDFQPGSLKSPALENGQGFGDPLNSPLLDSPLLEHPLHVVEPRGGQQVFHQICSASVTREKERLDMSRQSLTGSNSLLTLGQVHYDLAYYHSIGRFTSDQPDLEGAMFHLKKAGDCQLPQALLLLSAIYRQLPHNELEQLGVPSSRDNECIGRHYLLEAAKAGVRTAMIEVAREYEKGFVTSSDSVAEIKPPDWEQAVRWYKTALDTPVTEEDQSPAVITDPDHLLLSQLARLLSEGGHGLGPSDHQQAGDYYQQAADTAMAAMKGRLATRYYQLAEEEWSLVPEPS